MQQQESMANHPEILGLRMLLEQLRVVAREAGNDLEVRKLTAAIEKSKTV